MCVTHTDDEKKDFPALAAGGARGRGKRNTPRVSHIKRKGKPRYAGPAKGGKRGKGKSPLRHRCKTQNKKKKEKEGDHDQTKK